MKQENRISVVLPVYEKDVPTFFKEAVDSMLCQTLPPDELIIVVDGKINSELNSLVLQYSKLEIINVVRIDNKLGLANALNVAISGAKYPLIARMDADDISTPDRLEKQVDYLINNHLDIVGGQIIEFGSDVLNVISRRIVPQNHDEIIRVMKIRSPFSHPTVIFKKQVFDSISGYDVNMFPEDYDFFVRAYKAKFRLGNVKDHVLWFRLGENVDSVLRRRHGLNYVKNEFKLYVKFLNIGFYSVGDFLKAVFLKIPLRLIPFRLFKFLYFKYTR